MLSRLVPVLVRNLLVAYLLIPLKVHYPYNGPTYCVDATAVDQVERLLQLNQLLTRDHSAYAWLFRTLSSFASKRGTTVSGGRRGTAHIHTDEFTHNEDDRVDEFTHAAAFPTDTSTTRSARTSNFNGHRHHPEFSQKRKLKCCSPFQRMPGGPLAEKIKPLCVSRNLARSDGSEAAQFCSVGHGEQQQHQQQQQLVVESHQRRLGLHLQESSFQLQRQGHRRLDLVSKRVRPFSKENLSSDKAASDTYEKESKYVDVYKSGAREKRLVGKNGRSVSLGTDDDLKLQAVSEWADFLFKGRPAEAILENKWKLIEESWKRAELLYNNRTAFSASGYQVYQQKDTRTVIQAVLPFWQVDLPGALHDMAKAAAWRAYGLTPVPATRPLRLRTRNGADDTLVEIGYSPSSQRNTYTFGWNDTRIVYSTGVDPTEAWSLERIGGNTTSAPSSHLMEITSSNGGGKAFHDLSSRFYGHEINIGDVEVGLRHQFYNDTYNATPSNVAVRTPNHSIDVAADPTDRSYQVGIGRDETKIAVLRDFDEKRTAFRGDIMDWVISWDSDAQDANSSTISADALVGPKNEEPFLTAHVRRGEDGEYAEGDTQIQMRDAGMRMQWKGEGLTGDITLGKIKYKFDVKDGLPDFTLAAS